MRCLYSRPYATSNRSRSRAWKSEGESRESGTSRVTYEFRCFTDRQLQPVLRTQIARWEETRPVVEAIATARERAYLFRSLGRLA